MRCRCDTVMGHCVPGRWCEPSHTVPKLTERMKWSTHPHKREHEALTAITPLPALFKAATFLNFRVLYHFLTYAFFPSDQADLSWLEAPQARPFPGQSPRPCKRADLVKPFTPLLMVSSSATPYTPTHGASAKRRNLSNQEEREL